MKQKYSNFQIRYPIHIQFPIICNISTWFDSNHQNPFHPFTSLHRTNTPNSIFTSATGESTNTKKRRPWKPREYRAQSMPRIKVNVTVCYSQMIRYKSSVEVPGWRSVNAPLGPHPHCFTPLERNFRLDIILSRGSVSSRKSTYY